MFAFQPTDFFRHPTPSFFDSPDGKNKFALAKDDLTIFSHALLELRQVVTTISPNINVVTRKVDTNVGPPSSNDLELSQAALNRTTFNGEETDLAGAINTFATPLLNASEENQTADAPLPRFHILVTDGAQSTQQQRTDTSCTKGSDYVCVKRQILALLEKGWGGTVIGIKSEFGGKVYSEIQKGLSIQYTSTTNKAETYRPFYLYIFSPDRAGLEKLVTNFKERIRPFLASNDSLREFPLSSLYANGMAKVEIKLEGKAKDYVESTIYKSKDEEQVRVELLVDLNTQRQNIGMQTVPLKVTIPWSSQATDTGTETELLKLLKWELIEVNDEKKSKKENHRFPELKLVKTEVNEQGQVEISVGWSPQTGTPDWKMYRLVGRLNAEKVVPVWVKHWSIQTDIKHEDAMKTLNLETSLTGLANNSLLKEQIVAEFCIRVGED